MAWMFPKVLTKSDIKEGRVYLPTKLAKKFGVVHGDKVTVYDAEMDNSWNMHFITRDGKNYLGSEWGDFVEQKGLGIGDTITFSELGNRGATGERLFGIEQTKVGFDLNEIPSSPEN